MTTSAVTAPESGDVVVRPPAGETYAGWIRRNLFGSFGSAMLTVAALALLALAVPPLMRWAILDATWHVDNPAECGRRWGACWATITEKHRFILFGFYPYDEQWRPTVALLLYVSVVALSSWRLLWSRYVLMPLWASTIAICVILLFGNAFGLTPVNSEDLGGLPLTMVVFTFTVAFGFPLGILLALGRRSQLPVIRMLSVGYIEFVRGIPLVTVLFFAALIFPLVTPPGFEINKLLRVLVAMALFYACYFAEVIRGGLQTIPVGQYEAAASLGLGYWRRMGKVILPQALRVVVPGLTNHIISIFKNSTYVVVIGLYDVLNAAKAALSEPQWMKFHTEAYIFVAALYFFGAVILSGIGRHVEALLARGRGY